MRAVQKDEHRSVAWALFEACYRRTACIYPRIAILSFLLASATALVLWIVGEMLIDDARVAVLFTVAMGAITASLCRDIYGLLATVRLRARAQ